MWINDDFYEVNKMLKMFLLKLKLLQIVAQSTTF